METQTFKVFIGKISRVDDYIIFNVKYRNKTQPEEDDIEIKYRFKHLNDVKKVGDTIQSELIRITDLHNNIDDIRKVYEETLIIYDVNIVIDNLGDNVENEEISIVTESIGFLDKIRNMLKI